MILVDSRTGSKELLNLIRYLGVDADLIDNLDADFQFCGNGPDGELLIGVERKAISDLIDSITKGRLAGEQVGHMQATYDRNYLIVEGYFRRQQNTGLIETRAGAGWRVASGKITYSQMNRFLCSIQEQADFRLWRTVDDRDTAAYIVDQYEWWSKPWLSHRTHQTIYTPELRNPRAGHKATLFKRKPNLVERWLSNLTGVNELAWDLAKHFGTGAHIVDYSVKDWQKLDGIGKVKAQKIVDEIHRGK